MPKGVTPLTSPKVCIASVSCSPGISFLAVLITHCFRLSSGAVFNALRTILNCLPNPGTSPNTSAIPIHAARALASVGSNPILRDSAYECPNPCTNIPAAGKASPPDKRPRAIRGTFCALDAIMFSAWRLQ